MLRDIWAETGVWLTRTPRGWAEPVPSCTCRGRVLVGWITCMCGGGPLRGGHRLWTCRECGDELAVGCAGHVAGLDAYGGR